MAAGSADTMSCKERKAVELVLQIEVVARLGAAGIAVAMKAAGIAEVEAAFGSVEHAIAVGMLVDFAGSFATSLGWAGIDNDAHVDRVGSPACIGIVEDFVPAVRRWVCC